MTVMSTDIKKSTKSTTFEVALSETEFGYYNYYLIIVSAIIIVNTVSEVIGISYILPIAEYDLNMTQQQKSLLSGIAFAGIICSSHLWGFLADVLGRRKIMIPSLAIGFTVTVLSSFSINFLMLLVLRFINGIFICGGSATIFAYLGEIHTSKKRNKAIMGASFLAALMTVSFPFVAWGIINRDWELPLPWIGIVYRPWRLYMISCGIYGFLGSILLTKCYESPKFLLCIGEEEKALEVLRQMFIINTKKLDENYPVVKLEKEKSDTKYEPTMDKNNVKSVLQVAKLVWQQTGPLFSKSLIRSTGLLCFMQFCTFVSAHGMRIWMPEILNSVELYMKRDGINQHVSICGIVEYERKLRFDSMISDSIHTVRVDKLELGTIKYSVIFEAIYPIIFVAVATGMRFVGRVKIIFVILTVCGICGIATTVVFTPVLGIFLYLVQLVVGIGVTVINALAVDLFPTRLKSMAVSLALMCGRIGSVFGSNISGILMQHYCNEAFVGSGIMLIISACLGFLLPKPVKTVLPNNTKDEVEDENEDGVYITHL